ncbi:MAG: hypothetical protein CMO81_11345 [Waddliaceae bacterium]|nr:hypothetical protein [Waddliaceae bacterium]
MTKLNEYLEKSVVIGAAGKMGSGISLLILRELTLGALSGTYTKPKLVLVDSREEALEGLSTYLMNQLEKYAEKKGDSLGVSSDQFLSSAKEIMILTNDMQTVKGSRMVFEAILEEISVKTKVFTQLKELCAEDAYYMSNTSSIPISEIDQKAGLSHRIIGFHFYNPPAVQKLVELIIAEETPSELVEISEELGRRLGKILVPSRDVAGFIGNGHFIRDIRYACDLVTQLAEKRPLHEAVYLVNRVSQDYMIRPMGIFQLLDYVGLDICRNIAAVMTQFVHNGSLSCDLVEKLLAAGVLGGQHADGSQKDGIFRYEKGKPSAVFSTENKEYISLSEGDWVKQCDAELGELPDGFASWKEVMKSADRSKKLEDYFKHLFQGTSMGCKIAQKYLMRSREIAEQLVGDGIAASSADVNAVLENGFFHAYGPHNPYY